jgi:hypothetical protein
MPKISPGNYQEDFSSISGQLNAKLPQAHHALTEILGMNTYGKIVSKRKIF